MGRRKKTFSVQKLKEEINRRNRESTCHSEARQGWNCVLETVLMDTNQYKGFYYLTKEEVPFQKDPGTEPGPGGQPVFPDPTRRGYY